MDPCPRRKTQGWKRLSRVVVLEAFLPLALHTAINRVRVL